MKRQEGGFPQEEEEGSQSRQLSSNYRLDIIGQAEVILAAVKEGLHKANNDPIYQVLENDKASKPFASDRIIELVKESLDSSKQVGI